MLILSRAINLAVENRKQADLAQRLGIDRDAYPDISTFPINYFLVTLKPGMTKSEVHEIVKEYERVLHCRRYSEIYYYYSKDDDKALRFEVFYDEEGKYFDISGEGDSSKLYDEGCVPGLLSE